MAKDLLDKTGLTYLATKFQEWCEGLFVKKDTEYKDVYASDRGVKVSIGGTIGSPIISIQTTVGEISENNSSVVSGDMVKAYVDANKGVNTVFKAQTSSSSAVNGLVPAPMAGNQAKYLRGDGTWQTPKDTTYDTATTSVAGLMSAQMVGLLNGAAQTDNTISASDSINGVGVTIGGTIGNPTVKVSVNGGAIAQNRSSIVSAGAVYSALVNDTYIKAIELDYIDELFK